MLDRSSTSAPPADAAPEEHFAWAQTLLIRQVMRLEELSESALRLAQKIEHEVTGSADLAAEVSAKAGAEAPALDAAALSFSRVARAMHTTALLQSRLIGELEQGRWRQEARAEAEEKARLETEQEAYRRDPALGHKRRVEDIVERVARTHLGADDDALNRLMDDVCERLDDDDLYGDVMTRPVGELVALICRDLGLDPDWPRLAEEAWAKEEIESGPPPGSPFVRPPPFAAANGGGGPRAEEPVVEGEGQAHPPFNGSS